MEKIRPETNSFDGSILGKLKMKGMILKQMPRFIDESRAPDDLNLKELILSVFIKGTRESLAQQVSISRNNAFPGSIQYRLREDGEVGFITLCQTAE
ncbi:MAG: hypothetical protein WA137_12435 [Methanothrix sp.]